MVHEACRARPGGDLARRGMSVYKEKLGSGSGAPWCRSRTTPPFPGSACSYGIDDEGMPGQRTLLVDGGILMGFLHDRSVGDEGRRRPTGNGRRESYRHKRSPHDEHAHPSRRYVPGRSFPAPTGGLQVVKIGRRPGETPSPATSCSKWRRGTGSKAGNAGSRSAVRRSRGTAPRSSR